MPKFQKKVPKNWKNYFDPASDDDFKHKHPIGYGVLVFCGIVALLLPLLLLLLITEIWFPAPPSGFLLLAMAGCFIVGIGLFNIVAAWIGQYLGHWLTFGSLLLGGILIAVSLGIVYIPTVYAWFDERMVTFYFLSLLFFLMPPLMYVGFRSGVQSWFIRKGLRKKQIETLKKGKRNFWWYEALHEEVNMGLLYYANKGITLLYPVLFVLTVTLGWLRFMAPVITGLFAVLSLILAGTNAFSSVQSSLEEFGTVFAFVRRTKNGGFSFPLLEPVLFALVTLLIGCVHISITLDAFGIPH